jgi:hypothetical protein
MTNRGVLAAALPVKPASACEPDKTPNASAPTKAMVAMATKRLRR